MISIDMTGIDSSFLKPVLILVLWTLIMLVWMCATRLPAMIKAGINPDDARHPGTLLDKIPSNVRAAADNYNHLHEQPTLFYALMLSAALTGGSLLLLYIGFAYAGLRIVHSLVQVLSPNVRLRGFVFAASSITLVAAALIQAYSLFL